MPHTITMTRIALGRLLLAAISIMICACSAVHEISKPVSAVNFEKFSFQKLPNWGASDHGGALVAFKNSCSKIIQSAKEQQGLPMLRLADLQYACQQAEHWQGHARNYFETYFDVYSASVNGARESFFTGYYEPELNASLTRKAGFQTPIYALPNDLITVNLNDFDNGWQGKKLRGRIAGAELKPYWSRATINHQGIPAPVIAWAENAVDVFFLHIQGSGLLALDNGDKLRVGFAGRNGRPYTAIGKPLIEQGALDAATISMQSIRAWLANNPARAQSIMNLNESYIFFRPLSHNQNSIEGSGPVGAHGVPLTARHSIAVDPDYWHYGLPLYISAEHPTDNGSFHQLMIAQDTGSAIKGPLRGDVFWGNGPYATEMAGKMKSKGVTWVLLPKSSVKLDSTGLNATVTPSNSIRFAPPHPARYNACQSIKACKSP